MRKIYLHLILFCATFFFLNAVTLSQVVISQVYGGGGNSGATLKNDFIEIFNRGTSTVNLTGWSVQYSSTTGSTWSRTNLSGSINPGQYYLIQQAAGTGGTVNLPTPDATGTIAMALGAGKVALLNSTTTITSGTVCPSGTAIQDFVGYGTGTNCFEGSGPTTTLTNTTAALRKLNGCLDANNNSSDFVTGTPNPRNSSSPFNLCAGLSINDVSFTEGNSGTTSFTFTVSLSSPAGAGGVTFDIATQDNTAIAPDDYASKSLTSQTISEGNSTYSFTVLVNGDNSPEPSETFFVNVTNIIGSAIADGQGVGTIQNDDCPPSIFINQIQSNGNTSPLVGNSVTTTGVVTGIKTNGFFIQTPDEQTDANSNTSEGIFVFTSGAPPASVVVGNNLCVTGTVAEFIPSADPSSPSQTEITSPTIIVLSTGNSLPAPVILSSSDTDPSGGLYQLEKCEGMRVQINSMTVVAPTGGNIAEANATSASTGYFYGVITGIARPFREPGIELPDPLPAGAPATVTRWDANPELIGVASRGLFSSTAIDVATGAVLTNLIGPLDFSNRRYTIDIDLPSTSPLPGISNNSQEFTPVPQQTNDELTVASFNLERFYDNVNDQGGDVMLTATAYNNRLNKASLAIRNVLRSPDVIGVIEMENLSVLQTLAAKINSDAIATGQPNPSYVAYLEEGNDIGLIDVGLLVKSARVNVGSIIQYGKNETFINPTTEQPELLNDRPPLVLSATFNKPGCATAYPFTVIVNHLRSLNGVDDPTDGVRVRAKRNAQAEYLANLIQGFQSGDPNMNIISVGDYNAFEFNDGLVDVIGTIKGTPTPAANVVLPSTDLVNPDLTDLVDLHTANQRYSYSFGGSAQVLDHILVNEKALAAKSRFSIARLDADFPEIYRNDETRPERISDHDAPVAYFLFTDATAPVAICKTATVTLVNGSATITIADINNGSHDECSSVTLALSKTQFDCSNIGANTVTLTVTDATGNTATCNATVTVVGEVPSCSIVAVPSNNIYTGGVPTNIYLGYGPQSVTLNVTATGGTPFNYSWSGSNLSCTSCEDPVFTPLTGGVYNFAVTITNSYGCTSTCSITICVLDIRVPETDGKKVYICHAPPGNPGNGQTLPVNTGSVNDHLKNHPGDKLGQCGQDPCSVQNILVRSKAAPQRNNSDMLIAGALKVDVLPNPSHSTFTLVIESKNVQAVNIRILDINGREVSRMANLSANTLIKLGDNLRTGIYFAEAIQGNERKIVKLIKIE